MDFADIEMVTRGSARGAVAARDLSRRARLGRPNAVALDGAGWLDVLWAGKWQHPDGPEAVDAEDIRLCAENFLLVATSYGDDWTGIPFFVGHPEESPDGAAAPAVAWAKQARIDPQTGKLQLRPEWTADGSELRDSRAYKFISNYEHGTLDDDGIFHPHFISSVALTNFPVKREGQAPFANAAARGGGRTDETDKTEKTDVKRAAEGTAQAATGQGATGAVAAEQGRGQASDWWRGLEGRLGELVGEAEDSEAALAILGQKWNDLYEQMTNIEALSRLVVNLGNALGVRAGEGGVIDHGALEAAAKTANAAVDRAARLERELADERCACNSAIMEHTILHGVVADSAEARQNAIAALAGNRSAVSKLWFDTPAARRGATRKLPADPLAGARLSSAVPVPRAPELRRDEAGPQGVGDIVVRARAYQTAHGNCSWGAAIETVTTESEKGKQQ
jgi:hypothetical protein